MRSETASDPKFVWLLSPPWDGVWTRQNHFSRRFAADGAGVLYVENPVSLRARMRGGPAAWHSTVRRDVEPGLNVMSMPVQIPGSTFSSLAGGLNARRFAAPIARWLDQAGWADPIYWCRLPMSVDILDHLPPGRVVYDVTDDYVHYAGSARARALTEARENRIAARAGMIFTTTQPLAQRLRAINPNVHVVPNGVDARFFDPQPADDPFASVPHPRIGHVGLTSNWMDFELLAKIAARWLGQVISIGPVKPEVRAAYERIPGLVRLPPVHNLDLPRYLDAIDVCIQPHLPLEVRHRADPLKIVEYMAMGKPIVSTALRNLEPLSDVVELATDHQGFIAAIERALADRDPALRNRRIERARPRSWDRLYGDVRRAVLDMAR